jgi:hypothetical protein
MIDLQIGDARRVLKASIIKLGINNRINMGLSGLFGTSELGTAILLEAWFMDFMIPTCSYIDEFLAIFLF